MPKPTLVDVMKLHGITRPQLDAARQSGVNLWDKVAMAEHVKGLRHRLKPGAKIRSGSKADSADTIEQMEDALRRSRSIDEIKIIKEKLAALKIAVQVRTETRELVPVGDVRQSMTRIVSAARAELLKLSSDLPPQIAGLGEAKIQKIIRAAIVETLTRLADETNELYQP